MEKKNQTYVHVYVLLSIFTQYILLSISETLNPSPYRFKGLIRGTERISCFQSASSADVYQHVVKHSLCLYRIGNDTCNLMDG